jgi:hypothetical protein
VKGLAFVGLLVGLLVLACTAGNAWADLASPAGDAGVSAAGSVPASGPEAIHQVFAAKEFQFCHEPDYPLTPAEKAWCKLGAGQNKKDCPALQEVCANDATAKQLELREPFSIKLPELGLPMRVLLWSLLGIGLAVLIFALVHHFLDHEARQGVVATSAASTTENDAAAALARQVETDVQRLLERARAEAAAGDYRAAIGDAYAAWLRRLEGAGVVHVEPDQTNGDYLRKVQGERHDLAARMADVVDAVEFAQFGAAVPTRERFDGVWARVTSLLAERLGPALLMVWLLGFGVACGQPRADWEHSPSGRAAVVAYLGKRGFEVHERLLTLAKIADSKAHQLVLLPAAQLDDDEWKAVQAWVAAGNSLAIAGGSRPLPEWIGVRIVDQDKGKNTSGSATQTVASTGAKRFAALKIRVPGAGSVEPGPGSQVVLTREHGAYAAERWRPVEPSEPAAATEAAPEAPDQCPSRILVLADDFLFRNASLLVADNATALENLLREGGTRVELAGDLTGLVSSNPVESVKRGRLGPAMLQLLAFLLIFFVCKGARFGRPVETQTVQRREFAEHVRALGLHYARARADRHALACWGSYALERLRERCGLQVDRSLSGLADAVATRTGRPVGEVMRVLLEARDAKAGVPADKGARDLDTVAELCGLLEETGGTGGHQRIQSHV